MGRCWGTVGKDGPYTAPHLQGDRCKGSQGALSGQPGLRATSHPGQWTWDSGAPEKAKATHTAARTATSLAAWAKAVLRAWPS